MRVWIGTSGWVYRHWKGIFYPRDLPAARQLSFYAEHFPTVEINYSFYRLPTRENFEHWRDETPPGFTFAVKASRFLTHVKKLKDPEEPLANLLDRARGLGDKLGPILFQFPPNWPKDLDRLQAFLPLLPRELRFAFEFRNQT